MKLPAKKAHFLDALKIPAIRYFIGATAFFSLAGRALTVVIGFQIYKITHNPLALGWLGLVEAIPAISLVLFGGYAADHFNRKKILLMTRGASVICAVLLAVISAQNHGTSVLGLYAVIFLAGIARGFADPAGTAFEAQVVPKNLTVNASSWISSTWISCSIAGPAIIGFVFDAYGAVTCYVFIALSFAVSCIFTALIIPAYPQHPPKKEPLLKSLTSGWHFVFSHQPFWGAVILDLFAVLFGGAIALLPIYAEDILHVGAKGLGLLNAAPSAGALIMMLFATHKPPIANAGRNLLLAVLGFGISFIIFAFSKNFWLSMTALFFTGIFDGISMVIRRSIVRLLSPEHMRGRIAAANWIFICASNELGAFESGMLAAFIGVVPCVALGGFVTLIIVGMMTFIAPELRRLKFNTLTMEQEREPEK